MNYRIVWTNPLKAPQGTELADERAWDSRDMAQLCASLSKCPDDRIFRSFRIEDMRRPILSLGKRK